MTDSILESGHVDLRFIGTVRRVADFEFKTEDRVTGWCREDIRGWFSGIPITRRFEPLRTHHLTLLDENRRALGHAETHPVWPRVVVSFTRVDGSHLCQLTQRDGSRKLTLSIVAGGNEAGQVLSTGRGRIEVRDADDRCVAQFQPGERPKLDWRVAFKTGDLMFRNHSSEDQRLFCLLAIPALHITYWAAHW